MLLVFRKYRKTITAKSKKDRMFPEVTMNEILVREYALVQKVTNSVASKLNICKDIRNVVLM